MTVTQYAASSPGVKECLFCGESIKEAAKKCRYCGEFVDGRRMQVDVNWRPLLAVMMIGTVIFSVLFWVRTAQSAGCASDGERRAIEWVVCRYGAQNCAIAPIYLTEWEREAISRLAGNQVRQPSGAVIKLICE